jgi:hypothetical protein
MIINIKVFKNLIKFNNHNIKKKLGKIKIQEINLKKIKFYKLYL